MAGFSIVIYIDLNEITLQKPVTCRYRLRLILLDHTTIGWFKVCKLTLSLLIWQYFKSLLIASRLSNREQRRQPLWLKYNSKNIQSGDEGKKKTLTSSVLSRIVTMQGERCWQLWVGISWVEFGRICASPHNSIMFN